MLIPVSLCLSLSEHRANISADTDTLSELSENDRLVLQTEASFTNHENKLSNRSHFLATTNLVSASPCPSSIHDIISNPDQTVLDLISLLQRPFSTNTEKMYRGYMYNFSNIAEFVASDGKEGKPTVEFRRHECVIDAEATGCWVRLVEKMVRKAGDLAKHEQEVRDVEYVGDEKGFGMDRGRGLGQEVLGVEE
jgi:hypothetical protein